MPNQSRIDFVRQVYKLTNMAAMIGTSLKVIYENHLFGVVAEKKQSRMSYEYEQQVLASLSELGYSFADMLSCLSKDNPEGFNKIFSNVNKEAAAMVGMFNMMNAAKDKADEDDSGRNMDQPPADDDSDEFAA